MIPSVDISSCTNQHLRCFYSITAQIKSSHQYSSVLFSTLKVFTLICHRNIPQRHRVPKWRFWSCDDHRSTSWSKIDLIKIVTLLLMISVNRSFIKNYAKPVLPNLKFCWNTTKLQAQCTVSHHQLINCFQQMQ